MKNSELIDKYLQGKLTKSEKELFENSIESDSEFLKEFNFQKELQDTLRKEERIKTKEFLGSIKDSNNTKNGSLKNSSVWLAAASIILVIGVSVWFLLFNSSPSDPQKLYAQFYAPYENVVHPLERGEKMSDLKSEAFLAYESGNYVLALNLFDSLKLRSSEPYYNFYSAIVLMELEEFEEAKPLLESYIETDAELRDRAIWYLALTNIRLQETDQAKEQLNYLIELRGFKYKKAKDLNDKLP